MESLLGDSVTYGTSNSDVNTFANANQIIEHTETRPYNENPRKCRQIVAGVIANLSALAAGIVLAWTSPLLDALSTGKYHPPNIAPLTSPQLGWMAALVTLGAAIACPIAGVICRRFGPKTTLLAIVAPLLLVGWIAILLANNIQILYFGRFIAGLGVGACCVATPVYSTEIAHTSVRGTMGSMFQLMVTVGIFLAYLVGKFMQPYDFTIACAVTPAIFFVLFMFQPESPVYLIEKNRLDTAKLVLVKLRGRNYDIDAELVALESVIKENRRSAVSFRRTLCDKAVRKATLIAFALMFFQQFSGVNAVIMYSSDIFKSSASKLDPNTATILIGLFQVLSTLFASIVIDKLGRKFLLITSLSTVAISVLCLAIYFSLTLHFHILDNVTFSIVPVISLCTFIIAFSLGLGPIPWMISTELFPQEVKSIIGSAAGSFNWFVAFLLTKFYLEICDLIHQDNVFYIFASVSFLGCFFVAFIVPETKGKSLEQIQFELNQ